MPRIPKKPKKKSPANVKVFWDTANFGPMADVTAIRTYYKDDGSKDYEIWTKRDGTKVKVKSA